MEKLNPRGAVQKAEIRIKNGGGVHNEDTAKKYTKRNTAEQFGTISGRVQGTSVCNRKEPKWDPRGGGGTAHLGAHGDLKPVFGVYLGGVFFGGGRLPLVLF